MNTAEWTETDHSLYADWKRSEAKGWVEAASVEALLIAVEEADVLPSEAEEWVWSKACPCCQ